ncbi:DinB family protein [Aquipuribacter sp. SD81]|uniref:DinB family protein n=1 Tax=Aquipuribacter sp. SD81 TaxID=3127703 RepID=UPI0030175E8B
MTQQTDEQGRPEPPFAAGEAETLLGFLAYHRATIAWKCGGVDAAGLALRWGRSEMTLGGLLCHLAYVEDDWTARGLAGRDRPEPWASVDWAVDEDADWHLAASMAPEEALAFWRRSVERSDALLRQVLHERGLDGSGSRTFADGRTPSVRWVLVHLVEEYARHVGHADLLREEVDGLVGE